MIPPYAKTADWPRLVRNALDKLLRDKWARGDFATLQDFADDAAAAVGGIAIGEPYRTGSAVKVRVS